MSTEANLLHGLLHDRIRDLLHDREWYRKQKPRAFWTALLLETNVELHGLVRLARAARHSAVVELERNMDEIEGLFASEQADPLTAAKGYHDWQAR